MTRSHEDAQGEADGTGEGLAQEGVAGDDPAENSEGASGSDARTAVVFVSGCVAAPGVYELAGDARVADALQAAGGFADGAAPDSVNLARVVQDGEQIHIPTQDEVDAGAVPAPEAQAAPAAPAVSGGGGQAASGLVNINTADSSQLQTLPGIGEATAAKIIASREQEGPFASKEDLKRVSGIGEKKYAALEDLIAV